MRLNNDDIEGCNKRQDNEIFQKTLKELLTSSEESVISQQNSDKRDENEGKKRRQAQADNIKRVKKSREDTYLNE